MLRMRELNRRALLNAGAAGLALSMAPGALAQRKPGAKPPNILFILADDMGYADVSCYGRREYRTPAIDRLAAEGMRLTQAYANSSVCSATRVALATGRYQYRLPVGLEEPLRGGKLGLDPSVPTMASLLRGLGYSTTLIGKWHLGALPEFGPLKSGYDHFWGFRGGALDYFDHMGPTGKPDLWDDDREVTAPGYLTTLLGQRADQVIRAEHARGKPFFISLHFNAPHWPWEGPEDAAESARLRAKPGGGDPLPSFDAGSLETYARMVTAMDDEIGRLLATLDAIGAAEDTIVVFTSDNGGERYSDTWPFTGKKTELLEGGLRIPAILRWPAAVHPGVCDQVAISMDWLPTLLAAAGARSIDAPAPDGIDLLPWLTRAREPEPRTLFWRYHNMAQRACRSGDLKYLRILDNEFLFDVVADPLERANLKERRPEDFARLAAAFRDWDATMLPIDPDAYTDGFRGDELPDHFGIRQSVTLPAAGD
ncbi:MAG: sulfatase-like hydrolase/transferase [Sphingomonas sp.]|nr:sulfatase-like hydrolase/transferase [Sphingomonas sp.]